MRLAVTLVVALFASAIGALFLIKPIYVCDEYHPTVSAAKKLPQAKFTQLFNEAEYISRTQKDFFDSYLPLKTNLNLKTLYGISDPELHFWTQDYASVKLAACFDHSVSLDLENLNKPSGSISLRWGEGPESGKALLWKKSQ
jgi:hypothetical protein